MLKVIVSLFAGWVMDRVVVVDLSSLFGFLRVLCQPCFHGNTTQKCNLQRYVPEGGTEAEAVARQLVKSHSRKPQGNRLLRDPP